MVFAVGILDKYWCPFNGNWVRNVLSNFKPFLVVPIRVVVFAVDISKYILDQYWRPFNRNLVRNLTSDFEPCWGGYESWFSRFVLWTNTGASFKREFG